MTLKYTNTKAFGVSRDNYMVSNGKKFLTYKHVGCLDTWNPVQPTKPSLI